MGKSHSNAPLVEALQNYVSQHPASFHVPGHKGGAAFWDDPNVRDWLGAAGMYDTTELAGLDDLHAPEGAIAEAQSLAAQVYGAQHTYFLVGGSTVGNLAVLHAAAGPGELILMQRNVHKSALHALMLSGAGAAFIVPQQDPATGLYTSITAKDVEEGLRRHPETKAVFITNPNYYGLSIDVQAIAEVAHKYGKPLIVDEAHGAHFGFHAAFPVSALQCGADAVIQSTHKMLPAMTMGAMLHLQGSRLAHERIERRLQMLQSSSPSYLIMASLDWVRSMLHQKKGGWFEEGLRAAGHFENTINQCKHRFAVWDGQGTTYRIDPLKKLLYDREGCLTGVQIQQMLAEKGCYVELADERYALCVFSPASTIEDVGRLVDALDEIAMRFPTEKKDNALKFTNIWNTLSGQLSTPIFLRPDLAENGLVHNVRVEFTEGRISAEMVIPYPPGIPLLYPGEKITDNVVQALLQMRAMGRSVQGMHDRTMTHLRVFQ
jgi:arginine decarboxylase